MGALLLPSALARAFLGGLLAVCRADGDVCGEEFRELRKFYQELVGAGELDVELLLFSPVTPRSFAQAIADSRQSPFRTLAVSPPEEILTAFVQAALQVARVDGAPNPDELRTITAFTNACGFRSPLLDELRATLDIE